MKKPHSSSTSSQYIRLRGVRQNNLKNLNIDLPIGKFIVVTGLSGAGKSSLVFDTLHAEGQRRYVETFSAYTRQFLDLLNQPDVDFIENIRPSIAINQSNTVRTSRSTVGTMTQLTDYMKVWFSHVAKCYDPETGKEVADDSAASIWAKSLVGYEGKELLVTFMVRKPEKMDWAEISKNLSKQSYTRVLLPLSDDKKTTLLVERVENLEPRKLSKLTHLFVIQDRLLVSPENEGRFLESAETALRFGQNELHLFEMSASVIKNAGHYSRGLHSPETGRHFRPATPALFSFNSPLGACPKCRGFGRIIETDYNLAMPDHTLSIQDGLIKAFEGQVYQMSQQDLLRRARYHKIPVNKPYNKLTQKQRDFIMFGEPDYLKARARGEQLDYESDLWYGVKGFFDWLENNTYKMHVRVFLSRFRAYTTCPECHGARLQPEALCWKWQGHTLPALYQLPVSTLLELLETNALQMDNNARATGFEEAYNATLTRLRYLRQVGLDYLTLDRTSRTLSGGETQRVNLTSCLGTSLVDTLFVLDEPSIGLHQRDIHRLISIIRTLTDAGNTVVVVEHDEALMRAADHLVEIGPEPGSRGGEITFEGSLSRILQSKKSITGAYLSGRMQIPRRKELRPVDKNTAALFVKDASIHNIHKLSVSVPLGRLVALSGVSGSGKSTLLDNILYQGILRDRGQLAQNPAEIGEIRYGLPLEEVTLVDQAPLTKTPRSNPALYTGAWEHIRSIYASTEAAQQAGYSSSSFSFNAGDGRCPHCQGLGFERIEMQFLSDVYVSCPVCDGKRFRPEILAITWQGHSVSDLLNMSIHDALELFSEYPKIHDALNSLAEVGLGYLTIGQPLNTLSGGESQRLKLVRYLPVRNESTKEKKHSLILLDEPTTGLHRHDVAKLLSVLHRIVDEGHSIVLIEHNTDVLLAADWIIELGPEAGEKGGRIVVEGTPAQIAKADTHTSPYLRETRNGKVAKSISKGTLPRKKIVSDALVVSGARENNLKNLTIDIPHNKLNVVTGVSGSGKSTLAFDIVFAEGQRRFMESMSPYARQFTEQLPRPDIDALSGIPPTVAIEQRVTRGSKKSTVATITEVAQYLRLLYARLGVQHNPNTDQPVTTLSIGQLKERMEVFLKGAAARRAKTLNLCAPVIRARKGHHQPLATWAIKHGYQAMRIDGRMQALSKFEKLDRYKEHDIDLVISEIGKGKEALKSASKHLDEALKLGNGTAFIADQGGKVLTWLSTTRTDIETGESFPELDPKNFSHNSPKGWCPTCRGYGRVYPWMLERALDPDAEPSERYLLESGIVTKDADIHEAGQLCPECHGQRLNRTSRFVKLHFAGKGKGRLAPLSLPELLSFTSEQLINTLKQLPSDKRTQAILRDIFPQIATRLAFLDHVGLGYLTMERPTDTLSGGETQRIRLAAQLGTNLTGVLYVLDEPSIGLHAKDNERLIETLEQLRQKGNTLLVVEHDEALMERADNIIDLGPAAGIHGGELLAEGSPAEIKRNKRSLTGLFLKKGLSHPMRGSYRALPRG